MLLQRPAAAAPLAAAAGGPRARRRRSLPREQQLSNGGWRGAAFAAAPVVLAAAAAAGAPGASSQPTQPPLPPYSLLSTPVYALATAAGPGRADSTLSLVTYAAPISLKPRRYAVGLYVGTLSHANFLATGAGLLQILAEQHAPLLPLLGKCSGRDVDKAAAAAAAGHAVGWRCFLSSGDAPGELEVPMLEGAVGWMLLRPAAPLVPAGDHVVAICDVAAFGTLHASSPPLYTARLRELGLL